MILTVMMTRRLLLTVTSIRMKEHRPNVRDVFTVTRCVSCCFTGTRRRRALCFHSNAVFGVSQGRGEWPDVFTVTPVHCCFTGMRRKRALCVRSNTVCTVLFGRNETEKVPMFSQ